MQAQDLAPAPVVTVSPATALTCGRTARRACAYVLLSAGHAAQQACISRPNSPQHYTDGCLRTRKRRMVTAPDRVLPSGSRSIVARPGEE